MTTTRETLSHQILNFNLKIIKQYTISLNDIKKSRDRSEEDKRLKIDFYEYMIAETKKSVMFWQKFNQET